jgi:hypothetical protein
MRVRAFWAAVFVASLVVSAHVLVQSGSLAGGPGDSAAMPAFPPMQGGGVAIIVHPSNTTPDISSFELRQYFKGERTKWPNGRKVVVLGRKQRGLPERDTVLSHIYGCNDIQFDSRYFNESTTSTVKPINTTELMIDFVKRQPGAIGYVRADSDTSGVRVLTVLR